VWRQWLNPTTTTTATTATATDLPRQYVLPDQQQHVLASCADGGGRHDR
jgi:hypothetical protein